MKQTHSRLRSSRRAWRFCITIFLFLLSRGSLQAQSLTNFRIANGTSGENPAVLWVGVEQGFYRKHGLNVETIYMRVGSLAASALVSGDVNAVLTSSNAVLNLAAGGVDVVIIGALFHHPDGDFMARPEFKRPEDLKGKLIAIQSIGGGGWANNMLALDYLGLDPDRDAIRFIVLGDQPSRIQALETGRAQASWMGSTFSAPLKKKGYTLMVDLSRAPIPYVGSSLVVRKSVAHQEAKIYDALLKGTIDALRFFQKPENKPFVMKTMAKHLRLNRVEDAETGYNAMVAAYSSDLRPKPEGLQKIYSILSRTNPKLSTLKPETILDSTLIQRIQSSGY
ncbi:MAG TPA: ABC transporter substrate-binding protein [Candidatus Limnocylindrales bacterium]|nr:ABC transporter substrate-binding protein [Candidatus Limnocylindrales bacterium]